MVGSPVRRPAEGEGGLRGSVAEGIIQGAVVEVRILNAGPALMTAEKQAAEL